MITIYLQWISLHTRSLRLDDVDNKSVNIQTAWDGLYLPTKENNKSDRTDNWKTL